MMPSSTLAELLRLWSADDLGRDVTPPEVSIENCEVVVTWRGPDQRYLEVTLSGQDSRYMATWFAEDRTLRVQVGRLGLNAADIGTTIRWLLGGTDHVTGT